MKYAFLFFFFLYSIPSYSQPIKSFNDSQSILTIIHFLMDNAEDMKTSVRLSDRKYVLKNTEACAPVSSNEALKEIRIAINSIFSLYPDEELPVEEALADLQSYLGNNSFLKCISFESRGRKIIRSSYFVDSSDSVHVKIDTISSFDH